MTAECDSGFHRIKDVFNVFFVCVCVAVVLLTAVCSCVSGIE